MEGDNNIYRIYRKVDAAFDEIKKNSDILNSTYAKENGWSIFSVEHMQKVDTYDKLKNAVMTDEGSSVTAELNAYVSDAKAVLMSDAKTTLNTDDNTSPEPSDVQDPCDEYVNLTVNKVWKDFRNMDEIRQMLLPLRFQEPGRTLMEQSIRKQFRDMKIMKLQAIYQNPHGRKS